MSDDDKALQKVFHHAIEYRLYGLARYFAERVENAALKGQLIELLNYTEAV